MIEAMSKSFKDAYKANLSLEIKKGIKHAKLNKAKLARKELNYGR
jgi:hypothetical protein